MVRVKCGRWVGASVPSPDGADEQQLGPLGMQRTQEDNHQLRSVDNLRAREKTVYGRDPDSKLTPGTAVDVLRQWDLGRA